MLRFLAGLAVVSAIAFSPAANAQNISCTCRYKGQDYGLGESICLKSPDGLRMATCEMVLNNTSWQFSSAPCPLTRLAPTKVWEIPKASSPIPFTWQEAALKRATR